MNKENIVKNISLIGRKKSPTPHKNIQSQVSFKNLNHKSFYKHSHQHHNDLSLSPLGSKRLKTSTFRGQNSSMLNTDMSESIISNNNNPLAQAFKLERQSLMNTLKIYKDQIELLTTQQQKSKKEASKLKSSLKQKDQMIAQYKAKNTQMSKKVHQYQNMLPKLIELQQLQQKIIGQNNSLKNKIKVQEAILNNIANITKYQEASTPALEKIASLTQSYMSTPQNYRKR